MKMGNWVRSTAGSDRGKVYWILTREDGLYWLVDGKRHRIPNPKKKNQKHVQACTESGIACPAIPDALPNCSQSEQRKWEAVIRKTCRTLQTKE